jgi:hypothetical protein
MTNQEIRTFATTIILAGQYAEGATQRDMMVQEAILTTDVLLEGLDNMEPLKKRIEGFTKAAGKERRLRKNSLPRRKQAGIPKTDTRYKTRNHLV